MDVPGKVKRPAAAASGRASGFAWVMRNLLCLPYIAVRKDLIIGLQANSLFGMSNNSLTPSLDDLAILLAVTEAGGFRTAARRLGPSPSADRKSTRLNSSHKCAPRMPTSA